MSERVSVPGKNSGSISSLYNDLCDDDRDEFPECPSVCSSVKGVRYTGGVFMWMTIATFVGFFLTLIFFLVKRFKPQSKVIKVILYVLIVLAFATFVTGFIYYYIKSDFKGHFDKVDKHKRPHWSDGLESEGFGVDRHRRRRPEGKPENIKFGSGFDLAYIVLGIQGFLVLASRIVIGKFYS